MVVIGLTGNIGAGKSVVGEWLERKGALALDADKLAHRVIEPGGPAFAAVVEAFGPAILAADGAIDRRTLGAIVFAEPSRLATLEAIVHPAVLQLAISLIDASAAPVAVIEAIKLLEARNLLTLCQEVWVVTASEETRLRRLTEERGMSADEARRRMAAQSSDLEKVRQATRVIPNDGSLQELAARLESLWANLQAKYALALAAPLQTRDSQE